MAQIQLLVTIDTTQFSEADLATLRALATMGARVRCSIDLQGVDTADAIGTDAIADVSHAIDNASHSGVFTVSTD